MQAVNIHYSQLNHSTMSTTSFGSAMRFLMVIVLVAGTIVGTQAQSAEITVTEAVQAKNYVFEVSMIRPTKGGQRPMTGGYTLKVKKDTVVCDLPYIGRVYQGSLNPDDAGIKFTSTEFDYKITERKKGGWNIVIKPKDHSRVNTLNLTVYDDGGSSLDVTSNDREPIYFTGRVSPVKQ